jgi:hypothetical protein
MLPLPQSTDTGVVTVALFAIQITSTVLLLDNLETVTLLQVGCNTLNIAESEANPVHVIHHILYV